MDENQHGRARVEEIARGGAGSNAIRTHSRRESGRRSALERRQTIDAAAVLAAATGRTAGAASAYLANRQTPEAELKPSDRVIAFIERLRVPSGRDASRPFRLRLWQKDLIRDVYDRLDGRGLRQVRRVLWSMAKKNGKTALIAALVLVHLVGPEAIPEAQVASAANSRKQAALIFDACEAMVRLDAQSNEPLGLNDMIVAIRSKKRLVCHTFGSFYQSLSADGDIEEGISPTVWIYDELGRTKKTVLYESLSNATGAWAEPLGFIISVQARSPQLIMSQLVNFALRQISGEDEFDPAWSCAVFAVPEDCDPFDETFWPLANPGLLDEIDEDGFTLEAFKSLETIRDAAKEAKRAPSRVASFKNLQLNQQVDDLVASLHLKEDWEACGDPVDEDELAGRVCFGGLDLSRKIDLTGLALVFPPLHEDEKKAVVVRCWTPEHGLAVRQQRDGVKYREWIDEGFLIEVPGTHIDFKFVAAEIRRLRDKFDFRELAIDPWKLTELEEALQEVGVEYWVEGRDEEDAGALKVIKFIQGPITFNPAIEQMEIDVMEHRLAHGMHPVLKWCAGNAVTQTDHNSNRRLAKNKARARIDPYVALTMANGIATRPVVDDGPGSIQQGLFVA